MPEKTHLIKKGGLNPQNEVSPVIDQVKVVKPKPLDLTPDNTSVTYENNLIVIRHPLNSKIPKFTRIKTTTTETHKISYFRIDGRIL